jgi:membrane-associated protease RseP (regulator of RpoE activity)
VLGRYGARDATDAETLLSVKGLRYSMESALATHRRQRNSTERPASDEQRGAALRIRDLAASREVNGCIHCHDVNEILRADAQDRGIWKQSDLFRYPPTENAGFSLNVDRGDEVTRVVPDSPAAKVGLLAGDIITTIGGRNIRSIADAQFALDKAPQRGQVPVVWKRGSQQLSAKLDLPRGWKRSDISWRPSLQQFAALPRLYGTDLTAEERQQLGLTPTQLAFRHREKIHRQAQPAGVKPGDIILGFNDEQLDMGVYEFETYVRRRYVAGDRVTINLIRDGKPLSLAMTILRLY